VPFFARVARSTNKNGFQPWRPPALEKKLSPCSLKQFRAFAFGQCIGVWALHLQQALNRPSQHHPFSRSDRTYLDMGVGVRRFDVEDIYWS
jgi:hypothetical protein